MSYYFKNNYFNSYYYANIINNILSKDLDLIGFISNFFEDDTILYLVNPFTKKSAFHAFIEHIISEFFEDDMVEYDQKNFHHSLYADLALKEFGLGNYTFYDFIGRRKNVKYSDVEEYHDELRLTGSLDELYEKIANEVFYLMFNNRVALLRFNYIVSEYMEINLNDIDDYEIKKLFNKNGFLKRTRIPEWCKRVVFFRDRGRCCQCMNDLSGILSLKSEKHFDHIVPLAQGGLNDISNLQLLCAKCNLEKGSRKIHTSNYYESWY